MVRKTVIFILVCYLLVGCSKNVRFNKEKELIVVLNELGINKYNSYALMVIRTNKCDLCTDVAQSIFNKKNSNLIVLIDKNDNRFRQNETNQKIVITKPSIYFEKMGIDFADNYFFIIKMERLNNLAL